MNKPIIFVDFDGTICFDRFWRSLDTENYQKVQEFLFKSNLGMVNDWMIGKYSSEQINKILSKNIEYDEGKLWSIFINDCENMNLDIKALNTLNKLRKKYHIVLITGNMDCFSRFTVPKLNLSSYFDLISNSYYDKKLKTDNEGERFLEITKHFDSNIKDCYFFDDSINACRVFTTLGGSSYNVTKDKDINFFLQNL